MTSAARVLISRWLLSFIGAALLAQQVWVFGPLLEPLESWPIRAVIIAVLFNVWLVGNLVVDLTRRRRDTTLAAGITQRGPGEAAAEEAAGVRERLTDGLATLRKARGTRGYLYEQPWYAIIGPPGAGKTTALLNCGLKFPLAAEMGQGALAGVGGTRQCDWWFTDQAVLIDTAGRYTTQDSDVHVDRAGWDAFLDLLKKTRTRQPLNGVLVALAVSDIARATEAERAAHARAIRQRVKELETRLGVRMPVYLLFTKADLLAGFTEFFGNLDREGRAQVWGATFPLGAGEAKPGAAFEAEFQLLLERLNALLADRLQTEADLDRRALIAGFPAQVASLGPPIAAFIQDAFGGTGQDRPPFLRGVYLTSATQEGTPIDRLTGRLARSFGLDQRRMPVLRPEAGRSFFLADLLQGVIFNEAMLVSQPPGRARRTKLLRGAAYAVVALAVLAAGGALWMAQNNAANAIARTGQALSTYEQAARDLPLDPVSDSDLPVLLPLLDQARNLPHGQGSGTAWDLGLSQNAKLDTAAREVYRHALIYALLPRLIWRLEAEIRGRMNQPDFVYEATRVYLMLGNAGPLDRGLVHDWMMLDWEASYPGASAEPMRASLLQHLEALLSQPLPQVQLDGALVAQARSTFGRVSLAQRVYSLIRPSTAAQAIPAWKPREVLGPAGVGIFVRASGKSMEDGIPGFYTVDGFYRVLLPALANAAKSVASESWVLGEREQIDPNGPQMQAIQQQVIQLYEADYIRLWDAMLSDLNIAPMTSVARAAQDLYILASPESPMRKLLASIARQVTLTVPPGGAASGAAGAPTPAAPAPDQRLAALFGTQQTTNESAPQQPGHEVDEHFKTLRDLAGNGPGSPIDLALKSLVDLQQQLAKMAAAAPGSSGAQAPTGGTDPTVALRIEARRQPPPLSRWLASLATSGGALRGSDPRAQMASLYNADGGPAATCAAAVNAHYPFDATSSNDASLADFTKLFGPSGTLDGFVSTQLHPYIVMTAKPWTLQQVNNVSAPITAADLAQFQRAATIRETFFPAGATTPTIRFDIAPVSVDPGTKQATLDFNGAVVVASRAPPHTTQIVWPGANRMDNVKLTFDPPPANGNTTLQANGPWAMFRLLNQGHPKDTGTGDRYTLTFQSGDRKAVFELHAASATNPFVPGLLSSFRCPAVQP